MANFQKKTQNEINHMSIDEFCDYMSEWDRYTESKYSGSSLKESNTPQFETIEEARKYYGGISIEEFEQKYFGEV